jgi:hypothetical protein
MRKRTQGVGEVETEEGKKGLETRGERESGGIEGGEDDEKGWIETGRGGKRRTRGQERTKGG